MNQLRECVTAEDVRANYRATRARMLALRAPAPTTGAISEPALPSVPGGQQIEQAACDFGWWPPRILQILGPDEPLPAPQVFFEHPVTRITKLVCRFCGISLVDIRSDRRTANVVRPRQIAMYLARTVTGYSLPEIGRRFGDRDHTTVLHAVRKIEALCAKDPKVAQQVEQLLLVCKRDQPAGV